MLGLRGLRIERQAQEILGHLSRLQSEFSAVGKEFETLGGHLEKAHKKYDDVERKVERFNERLVSLSAVGQSSDGASALPPATA